MKNLLSCRYNIDTNRIETRFEDGVLLSIDCIAVEDDYGNTPAQRAELDWLLYNKPLEYAQLVLGGEIEHFLTPLTDSASVYEQLQTLPEHENRFQFPHSNNALS